MNTVHELEVPDSRALRVLLSVLDTGSISRAAEQLGVTQSAVSHTLERLRGQFGDALFVREGRGVVPTNRALELEPRIRQLLTELRGLTIPGEFVPGAANLSVNIAANDFQRDLLLPPLHRRVRNQVSSVCLDVVPSGLPGPEILVKGQADLLITPHPPEAADIFQRQLLQDRQICFYDADVRSAPRTKKQYVTSRHITLKFRPGESVLDLYLGRQGVARDIELSVSNFSAIPVFMRGTDLVATIPSLLRLNLMKGFASCRAPVDTGPFAMYAAWHRRLHQDPAHRWLREQLYAVAAGLPGLR